MTAPSDSPSFVVDVPDGVLIRDPSTGRIVQTGETVSRAGFWGRRLAAGEVRELVEPRPRGSEIAAEPKPSKSRAPRES